MLITANDVRKTFPGPVTVLAGVSLNLAAGEIVALTGESGSGKSTLLHIIAGLETSDGGDVTVCGQNLQALNDAGKAALRRHELGIVFQQFNLIPSLNVRQNLRFHADLAGADCTEEAVLSMAENIGLADQLKKFPEELSGGQQQRVAIGRALLHRPKLVLADEPTGNLDEATSDDVFALFLSEVERAQSGLLLVTHSQKLAARAHRRLHLSHGRIVT